MPDRPHVVVVGGGFAGQHAVSRLVRAGIDVTLVDSSPYATFQPLLFQVATGALNPGDVSYSLRRFVRRGRRGAGRFRRASVTDIDTSARLVHLNDGPPLGYDRLVLAQGVGPGFFGVPGAEEHSLTIYSRAEAIAVRDVVFSGLERLTVPTDRRRGFRVAIVGGGPTGVEMAGTLAELKTEAVPALYPEVSPDDVEVTLIELGPELLAQFAPRLREYTLTQLRRRGVDVRLGTAVTAVTADSVTLADGSTLDVDLVIWATGVAARPPVADWGLPLGANGRIVIDDSLRVEGHCDIYAVGDCAVNPERPLPQLAAPAIQMGRHAAGEILAELAGRPSTPFRYRDKGTMATIGRNAAVAEFPGGRTVRGFPAWLLWVGVHLALLLGGRNRVQAMVNSAVRYFSWPRSATAIVGENTQRAELPPPR